jgi:glucose/arabinose dehydrogenase
MRAHDTARANAGLAVARDGALLVSDDVNGVIDRVAHDAPAASPRSR